MHTPTPDDIDQLLPQTQCGLCGHGGCMPYAEAMIYEQAPINLCPPGGVNTLLKLADALNQDAKQFIDEMHKKEKPPTTAAIREAECIGCTKCISACPVDAIIGSAKQMHVVITDACTGCELCIPPCPVDCIDLLPHPSPDAITPSILREKYHARNQRLQHEEKIKFSKIQEDSLKKKQSYINEALARVMAKRK